MRRHIITTALFFCSLLSLSLFTSCGEDFQSDIDKLNETHHDINKRVSSLEKQVETINSQAKQLALLATAIENHFYLTEVVTTVDGYEITLSNGHKIILQKGPQNTLVFAPAISMTKIGGLFFWTLNGTILLDGDGKPLRTSGPAPIVKFNVTTQQWVISVDNGVTFQDINVYASVTLNNELLIQIINNIVEENSTTLFNQTMLYQIISTYIQRNYAELFDVKILNEVVYNYVHEHYAKVFSYELLEQIFNQYNYTYYTDQIDVDVLVNIILEFIRNNQNIFLNNEVLYEIISNYMEVNKTTIFDEKMLLEVINNFIQNNQNYINVELLTQIVFNYIDQHEEIVVNNKVIQNILIEYVEKNYTQIFQQNILVQILNNYITMNRTDIINQTLIEEILNNYVQNNFTTLIDRTVIEQIFNRYITENETTIIDRDILIEVIANYFEKNYNIFIDRTVIEREIENYIEVHKLKIIDVDVIEIIVNKYIAENYVTIFDRTIIKDIIIRYFEKNTTILEEYITKYVGANVEYNEGDLWATIIYNGESIRVPVYGKNTNLRNNVQSVVIMPGSNGHVTWLARMGGSTIYGYSLDLKYKVTPAHMANYIRDLMWHNEVTLELVTTDGKGNISTQPIYEAEASEDGILSIFFSTQSTEGIKAIALHIKEKTTGNGTDIMTEFTPVDGGYTEPEPDPQPTYYTSCPDDNHPHMIDLGLSSGTLWACCNVGTHGPSQYGLYYAWGKTTTYDPKSEYQYTYYGTDIAKTNYDAAYVLWGEKWSMPTKAQFTELFNRTQHTTTTMGGVKGYKLTATNGGSIFLSFSGVYNASKGNKIEDSGTAGHYWTSECYYRQNADNPYSSAYSFVFGNSATFNGNGVGTNGVETAFWIASRANGMPIRPVSHK